MVKAEEELNTPFFRYMAYRSPIHKVCSDADLDDFVESVILACLYSIGSLFVCILNFYKA